LTRDPWLDGVRASPVFADIVRRAEWRHRRAIIFHDDGRVERAARVLVEADADHLAVLA
jgi:hypothetical protein